MSILTKVYKYIQNLNILKEQTKMIVKLKQTQKTFWILITIFIFLLGIFIIFKSKIISSETPNTDKIFLKFSDDGLKTVSRNNLTNTPNIKVTKNTSNITLKEVYYDKSRITVGLEYDDINPYSSNLSATIYNNTTYISGSASVGSIYEKSKDIYYSCITFYIPENLPEKFDLNLKIQEQKGQQRVFEFKTPVDRKLLDVKSKEFFIDKKFQLEDQKNLVVKRILFTPSSTLIEFILQTVDHNSEEFRVKLYDINKHEINLNSMNNSSDINSNIRKNNYIALFNSIDNIPKTLQMEFSSVTNEDAIKTIDITLE